MSRTELEKKRKTSKNTQTIQIGELEMFETDDGNMRRPILIKKIIGKQSINHCT